MIFFNNVLVSNPQISAEYAKIRYTGTSNNFNCKSIGILILRICLYNESRASCYLATNKMRTKQNSHLSKVLENVKKKKKSKKIVKSFWDRF